LINELQLTPFNKHNCVAMLNTLYPPTISSNPTQHLTPTVLKEQREGWFRYITAVESKGVAVLENLINQGRHPGDKNGWPALRSSLDMYLRSASTIINECEAINSVDEFTPPRKGSATRTSISDDASKKRGRKADSGVSFNSERPSTSGSSNASAKIFAEQATSPVTHSPGNSKNSSTLERLAREVLRWKPKKPSSRDRTPSRPPTASGHRHVQAIKDDSNVVTSSDAQSGKKLRKMKSLGSLSDKRGNADLKARSHVDLSTTGEDDSPPPVPKFDVEAMKKAMEKAQKEREESRANAAGTKAARVLGA
jgi:hypothetical protein